MCFVTCHAFQLRHYLVIGIDWYPLDWQTNMSLLNSKRSEGGCSVGSCVVQKNGAFVSWTCEKSKSCNDGRRQKFKSVCQRPKSG